MTPNRKKAETANVRNMLGCTSSRQTHRRPKNKKNVDFGVHFGTQNQKEPPDFSDTFRDIVAVGRFWSILVDLGRFWTPETAKKQKKASKNEPNHHCLTTSAWPNHHCLYQPSE
jgi:hypothetical protein